MMEVQLRVWSFPISIYYNTYLGQFVFLYPIPVYKRFKVLVGHRTSDRRASP